MCFKYTLHLKKEKEKEQKEHLITAHAQIIRAKIKMTNVSLIISYSHLLS